MPSAPRRGATKAIAFALVTAPQNPTHSRDSRLAAEVRRRAAVRIGLDAHTGWRRQSPVSRTRQPLCGCPEQILL